MARPLACAALAAALPLHALAEGPKKIEDNSFLIEEAYNQEEGVVQHIQTFQRDRGSGDWLYTFTQEWPLGGQKHQLSYTIPYARLGENNVRGLGDIALNYRYQAVASDTLAVAPRLSWIVPSGRYRKGLGAGASGVQAQLPVSIEHGDTIVTHWNAGVTYTPRSREPGGARANTWATSFGASVVYLMRENFNLMLEAITTRSEVVQPGGGIERERETLVSPGARYAMDFAGGLQVVTGLAFPRGVGSSRGTKGVFLYLSFEHPFL